MQEVESHRKAGLAYLSFRKSQFCLWFSNRDVVDLMTMLQTVDKRQNRWIKQI